VEISERFALHLPNNFSLHKNGESFVQPKVFEVSIGHQITGPAMGYFMCDNIGQ
jgi:hypothetical protein